jgi:C1A family cysteine protease
MKTEIYNYGPYLNISSSIICMIHMNEELRKYSGGYINPAEEGEFNHYVTVVGWGSRNSKKYWIIKNTHGNYWGDNGLMNLEMEYDKVGNCL